MATLGVFSKTLICTSLLAASGMARSARGEDAILDLALDRLQGANSGEIDRKLGADAKGGCPDQRKNPVPVAGRSLASDRLPDRGSYVHQRELAESSSGRECVLRRKAYQQQEGALWAELSPEDRADRIFKHARRTFARLRAIKGSNTSSGSPFRDTHNPDF